MGSSKPSPFAIFHVCLISLQFVVVKSEFPSPIYFQFACDNYGYYTANSTYQTNLNTLLSSVSLNIDTNGFYNASTGENSDRVNVIALCRADLQPYQCHNYIKNATAEILIKCPYRKQAILWHEFCMVRYSNETILGTVTYSPIRTGCSTEKVTDPDAFYQQLNELLDTLRNQIAYFRYPKRAGAASRDRPNYQTTYAFEQCTPDITSKECDDCLKKSADILRESCDGAAGVRILRPSCYLRYETGVSFYNESMVETLVLPPSLSTGKGKNETRTIIIIVVPIVVCLVLVLSIFIYLKTKRSRIQREILELDTGISTIESLQYDFRTIRDATNNFSDSNKLGYGGFGVVYKGKLPKGNEIAVKRLSQGSGQGNHEFKNEVLLVARLQHRNLVRLLGFSVEGDERLLIYEYVQNGSLDRLIFDPEKNPHMDREKCYKIIAGVAKGLLYLHEDSRLRIIYRDLKPSNVLLDGEMNPKISDFGMARLFVPSETQQSTSRIAGTYGYMAPEYIIHGQFSIKSDVFSFGILVLEIVTGKRICEFQKNESMEDLLSCVWKNWHQGSVVEIIHPALRTSSRHLQNIMRCIHIGLLCVQENPIDRPTMGSVVLMLSSFSLTLPIPSQPAFFMSRGFYIETQNDLLENISSNDQSDNATNLSTNEVSMSEFYPR